MAIITTESKTIHTTIVGIPATEWKSVQRQRTLLKALKLVAFVVTILGFMVACAVYMPGLVQIFNLTTINGFGRSALLAIAVALPLMATDYYCTTKITRLQDDLLKRHGWDGSSRYRVELEYQQFLHE